MFCPNCGSELSKEMTFCGKCGREVKIDGLNVYTTAPVDQINLSSLTGDLANCEIEILEVRAKGPDVDNRLSVNVKYKLNNDTEVDWNHLNLRIHLLNAFGQIIHQSKDEIDKKVPAGQGEEFEERFWIEPALLAGAPEIAHIVLNVFASKLTKQSLGRVTLPDAALSVVQLKPITIDDAVRVVSGSVWRGPLYGRHEYSVDALVLVQNVTKTSFSQGRLNWKISGNSGNELTEDIGELVELPPGAVATIAQGYRLVDGKKFAEASIELDLLIYIQVAAGLAQRQGVIINEEDLTGINDEGAATSEETTEEVTLSNEQGDQIGERADSQEQDESTEDIDIEQWNKDYRIGIVRPIRPIVDVRAILDIEKMNDINGLRDIALTISKYLDYVIYCYCDWKASVQWGERDRLESRDGPYSDILAKVYEWDNGEPPNEEFYDPEIGGDYGPWFDALWGYMMEVENIDDLAVFLYRYILAMRYPEIEFMEVNFEIPADFNDRKIEILTREMERTVACYIHLTYAKILKEREA
jgi:hypothetical protein